MNDDKLDEKTQRLVAEYHRPPAAPREEMWQVIARERSARRSTRLPGRMPARRIAAWGLAAAALVALGVGLDRMTARIEPPAAVAINPAPRQVKPSVAQQMVTQNVLGQAEVFLTGYRADVKDGKAGHTDPAEAKQLLSATRLLLESRMAADPRLRVLLQDLELTLAQITQDGSNPEDAKTITQGFEQRGVLTQLRSKVKSGPSLAVSQGAI